MVYVLQTNPEVWSNREVSRQIAKCLVTSRFVQPPPDKTRNERQIRDLSREIAICLTPDQTKSEIKKNKSRFGN